MKTALLFIFSFFIILFAGMGQKPDWVQAKKFSGFIQLDQPIPSAQMKAHLASRFEMTNNDELRPIRTTVDKAGITHDRFQQFYKSIPVEGAVYIVHSKNGMARVMNGDFFKWEDLTVAPGLSEEAALTQALAHVNGQKYAWEDARLSELMNYQRPRGELVILPDYQGKEPTRLAYKFDIYSLEPLYRAYVYIDARDGSFIAENQRIHHQNVSASGNARYDGSVNFVADQSGSVYRLRETAIPDDANYNANVETYDMNNGTFYGNATDVTSNDPNSWSDDVAVQAHWGAEKTHAFFLEKYSRQSFDNASGTIKSYVHYSNNYDNAFWNGSVMTYGDGGTSFTPLVSVDVVGHEITHGVTENEANLVYSYESGALNESFSDIFGEAIENYARGPGVSNDWLMGAQITKSGGALRSMSNPNQYGDPDTYFGSYWYTGSGDNGGVHINSGVQNFWFYLLANGGSGTNDIGNAYNVTAIGIEDAAAIAYLNLTGYLTPNSGYEDARNGAINAAISLFGENSQQAKSTADAWYAVGIGCPPGEICYCASRGNSVKDEWIARVEVGLGIFENTSGAQGYTDFTDLAVDLVPGQTYDIRLSPGFSVLLYNEWWRVWIDYNMDGDFNDAGELAFDAGGLSNQVVNGSFTVPSNASGSTRMRVSMKYNGAPSPCEAFSFGEVEDYTINFDGNPPPPPDGCTSIVTNFDNNPITANANVATVSYSNPQENVNFTISGIDEKIATKGNSKNDYTEIVSVIWWDETNTQHDGGTYNGSIDNSAAIDLSQYLVTAITVSLSNGQPTSGNGMSVSLSSVASCDPGGGGPGGCTEDVYHFPGDALNIPAGQGSGSTGPLTFGGLRDGAQFTISGLSSREATRGNTKNNHIDEVTVTYNDGSADQIYGVFNANDYSNGTVQVNITGNVASVTVNLADVYDPDTDDPALDITFSQVTTCIPSAPIRQSGSFLERVTKPSNNLLLYPNPATQQLSVQYQLDLPSKVQLQITDMNGRSVQLLSNSLEAGPHKTILNVNDLPAGVYLLHLWKGERKYTERFVILK